MNLPSKLENIKEHGAFIYNRECAIGENTYRHGFNVCAEHVLPIIRELEVGLNIFARFEDGEVEVYNFFYEDIEKAREALAHAKESLGDL